MAFLQPNLCGLGKAPLGGRGGDLSIPHPVNFYLNTAAIHGLLRYISTTFILGTVLRNFGRRADSFS